MGLPHRPRAALFAALLGVVLATGFLLEAHKIASPRAFHRMTDTFAGAADPAALASLRALWAREYGVAFDVRTDAVAADVTEAGRRLHEEACASCHAKPASAFVSWPLAKMMAPVAGTLDAVNADAWLLHLHVLACFAGLALLPFTTFLHVLAAPFSLLLDAAARHGAAPARPLPRRRACDATRTLGRRLRPLRNVRSRLLGRDIGAPPRQSVSAAFAQARRHARGGESAAAGRDAPGRSRPGRRSPRCRRRLPVHRLRPMHRPLSGGTRPGRPVGRGAR